MRVRFIDHTGKLKVVPNQNEKIKRKYRESFDTKEDIDICLNCTKSNCTGWCEKMRTKK